MRKPCWIVLASFLLSLLSACDGGGLSGYEIVERTVINHGPGAVVKPEARCPPGKKVVGGGGTTNVSTATGDGGIRVLGSSPVGDDAWRFESTRTTAGSHEVTAYAICVDAAP